MAILRLKEEADAADRREVSEKEHSWLHTLVTVFNIEAPEPKPYAEA